MRESEAEQRACNKLKKSGWKIVKCIQMSENGWPDRQLLKKPARIVFVEFKRPSYINDKGKVVPREEVDPDGLQAYRHKQLREMGFEVIVAWGEEEVKHLIDEPQ